MRTYIALSASSSALAASACVPRTATPADAPAATILVRYIDASGEMQGPFPIKFDPEAALIRDQRKILDMIATSWLSFREFNGLLVYYSHLMSYRCAIREVRIGIDTAVPDKVLKMPPCDLKDPSAIPYGAQLYQKLAPQTQSVSVELTYRDGSVSEIKSFRRWSPQPMTEKPPSTGIAVPVTKSDALDERNTAMPAKSADAPHRAAGVRARTLSCRPSISCRARLVRSVSIQPGSTALAWMLSAAQAHAQERVNCTMPPLLAA